jgi:hypothetical protein
MVKKMYQETEFKHLEVSIVLTTQHPLSAKVRINFADRRRKLGQYSSLMD